MLEIKTATPENINFLIEAIVESEKSGTDRLITCHLYNLNELEYRKVLYDILSEDIPDWDLGLSQFRVLFEDDKPCGAYSGWIEKRNSISSRVMRLNAYHIYMPESNKKYFLNGPNKLAEELEIDRSPKTIQTESLYISPQYRGKGYSALLISALLDELSNKFPEINTAQIQLFAINKISLAINQNMGYRICQQKISESTEVTDIFPGTKKYMLEKTLHP